MSWVNYSVEVPRTQAEAAEAALEQAGAQSVSVMNARAEPVLETAPGETRLWDRVRLMGLFPGEADPDAVRLRLAAQLGDAGLGAEAVRLEDRDWSRVWLDRLVPMRFGNRLWIVPGPHEPPAAPGSVPVKLDPGLAFGTGTHPTTALCLEWLDANPPDGVTVIDYGCGSGVLGLAAAALGAESVWCTDHDPQALAATRDNAERNGFQSRIRVVAPADVPRIQADALLANILLQPLVSLRGRFTSLLRPGGRLLVSGMLDEQVRALIDHYRGSFHGFETTTRDGWSCVSAFKLD